MSSQAYADWVKEAEKKRLRYVIERARLRSNIVGGRFQKWITLCGSVALAALSCFVLVLAGMSHSWSLVFCSMFCAVMTILWYLHYRRSDYCIEQARIAEALLVHVPPVAEQIAALPAEEILVRGSDSPATLSGELLRAAQSGAETGDGELLRADLAGRE